MNYEQARAYAVNVSRSGSILGLDSIEKFNARAWGYTGAA